MALSRVVCASLLSEDFLYGYCVSSVSFSLSSAPLLKSFSLACRSAILLRQIFWISCCVKSKFYLKARILCPMILHLEKKTRNVWTIWKIKNKSKEKTFSTAIHIIQQNNNFLVFEQILVFFFVLKNVYNHVSFLFLNILIFIHFNSKPGKKQFKQKGKTMKIMVQNLDHIKCFLFNSIFF